MCRLYDRNVLLKEYDDIVWTCSAAVTFVHFCSKSNYKKVNYYTSIAKIISSVGFSNLTVIWTAVTCQLNIEQKIE